MNDRISFDRIRAAPQHIDPVFLNSPQYNCEPLSALLGVDLTLKVETVNPIRCFKGRGAELFLARHPEARRLVCASAGNFGQAMAFSCRKSSVRLTVYASVRANPYKLERMKSLGADLVLHGEDFDAAKTEAKRQSQISGVPMVEDGLAVETVEGAGTLALEMVGLQLDALLVPLGNGALFNGVATVFRALSPTTRLVAVQAAGAPAMVESWRSGKLTVRDHVNTIADGIAVRIPIPEALEDMKQRTDEALLVGEESILQGMKMLHLHAGLVAEPSAAVGIAALLENKSVFAGKRVGTIICGGNLTETQVNDWLR